MVKTKEPPAAAVRKVLRRFPRGQMRYTVQALQAVQEEFGWLPPKALKMVAEHLNLPLARVLGVATFYAQFYFEPRGRHTIRCCRGTACHVRGAAEIIRAVEETLGVQDGQTTPDQSFSFETVACLGACALAPVVVIDERYYGKMTPEKVRELLARYRKRK